MNNKEWYLHCIEYGLCVACHKPNDRAADGKRYCSECAKKNTERNNDQRMFYLSMGICPICRTNTLMGDMRSCDECRADRAAKKTEQSAHKIYAYNAERRKRFREQHRCISCGADIPEFDSHSTCEKCREKRRTKYAEQRSKERKHRPSENKCYICGSTDLLDGKNICTECYERILKNTKKMHEARRRKADHD